MHSSKTTKPARISLYLNNLEIGGAETIVVELSRGFVALGFQVDFVLLQARGALLSKIPVDCRIINLNVPNAYAGILALIRYLRDETPAVLLSVTELTGIIALFSRILARTRNRVVVMLSTTTSKHKRVPWKKLLERVLISLLYPGADSIVAVARGVAEDFVKYAGIAKSRLKVIYSPLVTPRLLAQARESVPHPFFQAGQPPVILGVGRLSEAKNFPMLIRAFALVRSRIPSRLLILGEGEQRTNLEAMVRSLGLDADVSLPGFVPSPFPYMSKAAVFVLSSSWEGLPGALIEAMACGAPVVSTNCPGGPAEVLEDGRYGHLVPVGDVKALADAIEASLKGDYRRPPAEWLDQFRPENVVQEYLEALGLAA